MAEAILKGRLDGRQRNRLKGLFDMMYTPRELAEEIGKFADHCRQQAVSHGSSRGF